MKYLIPQTVSFIRHEEKREKELKINKKGLRKQAKELDDKVKVEIKKYKLTDKGSVKTVQILTKKQLRKRQLKEKRRLDKLDKALSYMKKDNDFNKGSNRIKTEISNGQNEDKPFDQFDMPIIQSQLEKEEIIVNNLGAIQNVSSIKDNEISIQNNSISNKGSLEPEKKLRSFIATNRNLTIVKYLKNLYQDKCQVCGERIEISPGNFLSEVHHLKPLGAHNGPDVTENMIVLCPNHHAMFDRGAITIDIDKRIVIHTNPDNPLNNKSIELKHEIDSSYIDYHNANIFINSNFVEYQNHEDVIVNKDEPDSPIQIIDFGNTVTLQDLDTSELFEVKLEDRFNRDFMKPIEKVILHKCLNHIVQFDKFRYQIIDICTD